MTDWTLVAVIVFLVAWVLVLVALMVRTVPADQVGLLFRVGMYRRALPPGRHLVPPFSRITKVRIGGGPNGALGMEGVALTELDPDRPAGTVRIGDRTLPARSYRPIPVGHAIRVIEDDRPGIVVVSWEPAEHES